MSATAVISRELQALRNELTLTQGELKRTQEDLTILQKAFEPYKGNQEKIEQLIWTFNLARKLYRNHPCRECQAADRAYAKEKQKSTPPPPSTATTSTAATPTDLPTPPKPSNAEDSHAALSEPRGGAVLPTQPQASATTSKGQGPMDVKMAGVRPAPTGSGSSPPATPLQKATILAGLQAMNMNLSSVSGIADVVASRRSSSSSSSSSCNSSTSSSTPSTNGGADMIKPPEPSRSKKRDEPCSSSPPPPPPPPLAVLHVDAGPAFHVGNTKVTAPEKDRRSSNRHVPTKRKTMGGSVTTAGKAAGTRRPSDNKTGSCATNKHVEPPLFAPPGQNGPFQFGKWQGLQPDGTPQFFTFKFGTGVTIPSISISKISATTPTTTTSTSSSSGTEAPSRPSRTLPRDAFDCEALFKAVEMLQGLHSLSPAMEKPHTAAKVDADEGPSVSPVK